MTRKRAHLFTASAKIKTALCQALVEDVKIAYLLYLYEESGISPYRKFSRSVTRAKCQSREDRAFQVKGHAKDKGT